MICLVSISCPTYGPSCLSYSLKTSSAVLGLAFWGCYGSGIPDADFEIFIGFLNTMNRFDWMPRDGIGLLLKPSNTSSFQLSSVFLSFTFLVGICVNKSSNGSDLKARFGFLESGSRSDFSKEFCPLMRSAYDFG